MSRCGFAGPADVIAATNIGKRACVAWAFVSMPVPNPTNRGKGDATPGTTAGRDGERNKACTPEPQARPFTAEKLTLVRAAAALNIHRNTLVYRLDKIARR